MAKIDEEKVSTESKELLADVIAAEKKKKTEDSKEEKDDKPKKKSTQKGESGSVKKLKHGAMATTLTIVFFVFLVLVNVVATKLFERYPITIDLTKEKIYSISEQSEDYIKSIDMDVMITVCADEQAFAGLSTYTQQANEVMKTYSKYNDKIKYQYMDINANPDFYKDYTDEVAQYDIIVETNPEGDDGKKVKRTRVIGLIDLVQFNDELTQMFSQYGVSVEEYAAQVGNDLTFISYYGNYIYLQPTGEWSLLPDAGQIYRYQQTKAVFAGTELQFTIHILRNMTACHALDYNLNAEYVYTRNLNARTATPYTPPANLRQSLNWKITPDLSISPELQLIAPQNHVANNELRTPGAVLLHLNAGWYFPFLGNRAQVNLTIKNITNQRYYNHLSYYRTINIPEPGTNFQLSITLPMKI